MAKRAVAKIGAERELEWYFCCAGSVMGLHAGSLEPGGGAFWDASSLERLHLGKLEWQRRRHVREVGRIEAALCLLSSLEHEAIVLAFTPRPWDPALRTASGVVGENGTLAGLVVMVPEAMAEFIQRRKRRPKDRTELERHFSEFARTEARAKVFRPLVTAARKRLDEAVEAYCAARASETLRRKAEERSELERIRAGQGL